MKRSSQVTKIYTLAIRKNMNAKQICVVVGTYLGSLENIAGSSYIIPAAIL